MKSLTTYANKKMRKGATLIELIVVIVIMAILSYVISTNLFTAKDDANKTRETETITALRTAVNVVKAQNGGNIYGITQAPNGVGDKILATLTTLPSDLTYYIGSTYTGQNTSTNLIAFATTDEGKTVIREAVEKLDLAFDGTASLNSGSFRGDLTCTANDGSDCYYQVQLTKSGNIPGWETTIGGAGLTNGLGTSTTDAAQTWVRLVK